MDARAADSAISTERYDGTGRWDDFTCRAGSIEPAVPAGTADGSAESTG